MPESGVVFGAFEGHISAGYFVVFKLFKYWGRYAKVVDNLGSTYSCEDVVAHGVGLVVVECVWVVVLQPCYGGLECGVVEVHIVESVGKIVPVYVGVEVVLVVECDGMPASVEVFHCVWVVAVCLQNEFLARRRGFWFRLLHGLVCLEEFYADFYGNFGGGEYSEFVH